MNDSPFAIKNNSLLQKAALNSFSIGLDYGVRMLVSLVVSPILLLGLGSNLFGIWQLLTRAINYISGIDGRPTTALKWMVANQQNETDHDGKLRAIGSAIIIWLLFLPFVLTLAASFVWFLPGILKIQPELSLLVQIVASILLINIVLDGLNGIPEAILRGMNLGYKRMGMEAGILIFGGILSAGTIYVGWGLIGVAVSDVTITLMVTYFFWRVTKTNLPWVKIIRPRWTDVRQFFSYSGLLFISNLITRYNRISDVVILGISTSAFLVTDYYFSNYAANMSSVLPTLLMSGALPGIGGFLGLQQKAKVSSLRGEMMGISWLVTTTLGTVILLWNKSFVTLWIGQDHYAGHFATLLMVIAALQAILTRNDDTLIDISLNVRQKIIFGLSSALISTGLSAFLGRQYGISGFLCGLIAGRMVTSIGYPIVVGNYLGIPIYSQQKAILRPFLVTAILFLICYHSLPFVNADNWFFLILGIGVTGLATAMLIWFMGLDVSIRRKLFLRLSTLIGSGTKSISTLLGYILRKYNNR